MSDTQNIDTPHERRPFRDHGHMDVVTLGGFTVGARARLGSTSLVGKEVPAGTTVVGIPARAVGGESAQKLENQAKGRRFAAYGLTAGVDDPLAKALQELIEHIAKQDQRIDELSAELTRCGMKAPDACRPIDAQKLSKLVE